MSVSVRERERERDDREREREKREKERRERRERRKVADEHLPTRAHPVLIIKMERGREEMERKKMGDAGCERRSEGAMATELSESSPAGLGDLDRTSPNRKTRTLTRTNYLKPRLH